VNILKREDFLVLVYELRGYFFFFDLAEQAIVHEASSQFAVYTAGGKSRVAQALLPVRF
jgi:hypothetical protein